MHRYKSLIVFAGMLVLFFSACQKKTDDHNQTGDDLKNNLFQLISVNSDLSKFAGYLKQTGYDTVIASSRTYTVFALNNVTLNTLDPAIANNPAKLKLFIGNHIANQLYYTAVTTERRIPMLNGKYNNLKGNKIEDANITDADNYASNGVYHIIDKGLLALENCWEFMSNNPLAPTNQKDFMLSIFRNVFDTTNAVVIGINPTTGEPIYQQGTDSVYTNLFWNKVHDLRDEKKQYTFFMLTNTAFDAEVNKFKPFFNTFTADSTTLVSRLNVIRDFAVDTVYDPATIPDSIVSKFGVKVPVVRSAIVQTIKTSNGIVYIMDQIDVPPAVKFKPIVVEAENYLGTSHDRRGNTYFRDRFNPITGKDFRDVLVLNHGVAQFNIAYRIQEVPSIKYKAYWVALNDFQTATFTQKLGIGSPLAATFPYTTVNLNNHNEVYIGEFTMANYDPSLFIFLTAANSTTAAANPLVCDYIKLVPSF
jgi:uncharacterized surface protein with fasciclin (FAS1) repeats